MRHRFLRRVVIAGVAGAGGSAVVLVCVAAISGWSDTQSLARGYLGEAKRLTDCGVAFLTPFGPEREDYRVYDAAMDAMFPTAAEFPPVYLVTNWPDDVRPVPAPREMCFGAVAPTPDLLHDFWSRNQMRWGLSSRFRMTKPATLLPPAEFARRKLGGPVERVELSRVGYDDRGNALVYLAHYCGLCGGGYYMLLTHESNDAWAVVDFCMMWVS